MAGTNPAMTARDVIPGDAKRRMGIHHREQLDFRSVLRAGGHDRRWQLHYTAPVMNREHAHARIAHHPPR
jgi:hypothetical protein